MVATHDVRGPDGKRIENVGVKVDHEVRQTLATVRSGHDVVIDRALADLARARHATSRRTRPRLPRARSTA